eukprot:584800-Pyramimonas_sp.AAC.1
MVASCVTRDQHYDQIMGEPAWIRDAEGSGLLYYTTGRTSPAPAGTRTTPTRHCSFYYAEKSRGVARASTIAWRL